MSKDASIGWMYEGAKGNVHREDYLLGKKVDKNFEKYSDVVNTQKAEVIDSIVATRTVYGASEVSTGLKTSSLQKDIIKSEDPFVAVKVREETKRREIMDNPLMKMRLQNMLKTMMTSKSEKKDKKKSKKEKKKKKKRSRSSSSSSRDNSSRRSSPKRSRKTSERDDEPSSSRRRDSGDSRMRRRSRSEERRRSPKREKSPERHRKRSRTPPKRQRSRSRSAERTRRKSSRSPKRRERSDSRSPIRSKRSHQEEKYERKVRRKSRSRSPVREGPSSSGPTSSRQFDSHIPAHLQNKNGSSSDSENSEDEQRRSEEKREKSYGLVEMRKRTASEREEESRAPSKEYKLVKLPTGRGSYNNKHRREPRKVLTEEEKAARLAEMQQDNVKWREDVRAKNVAKGREEDEEEKKEAEKNGYAPSFLRSQMRDACDDMTVEKRLQSKKGGMQRSHGYMDRSFARK